VLIPPLERIFNLVGADVQQWFSEIPKAKSAVWGTILASPSRRRKMDKEKIVPTSPGKQWDINIEGHFENNQCFACEEPSFAGMCNSNGVYPLLRGLGLCEECTQSLQSSLTVFGAKSSAFENRVLTAHEICITCAGTSPGEPVECISLDCPWLYARKKAEDKLKTVETMELIVNELEQSETQFIASWGDMSESEM